MNNVTNYLPTHEMMADFEKYKNMSSEERLCFQESRARRIEAMTEEEKAAFKNSTRQALVAVKEELEDINLTLDLGDVAQALSLSYIAKAYFGKSKAWLYQRLNGHKVNGKPARFTEEERKRFAEALLDLSQQIEITALKFI